MHTLSAGIGWVEFTTLLYLPLAGGFYTICAVHFNIVVDIQYPVLQHLYLLTLFTIP